MAHSISHEDVWSVARRHWRQFLPMWAFPVAFFLSVLLPEFATHPFGFFCFLVAPVFFACYWVSSQPIRQRQVSRAHGFVWLVIAPFCVWAIIVGGFWALAFLTGAARVS
jgi:hypothetical protein